MTKFRSLFLLIAFIFVFITPSLYADGFIKKEVYTYKDEQGNLMFTDRKPKVNKTFETQTIEAAKSTGNTQIQSTPNYVSNYTSNNRQTLNSSQTVRIVVDQKSSLKKTKTNNIKRCKSYKKKFDYYSDKMKSGYKNSEYKILESNRKKYKNLLFNNCETKTFDDY